MVKKQEPPVRLEAWQQALLEQLLAEDGGTLAFFSPPRGYTRADFYERLIEFERTRRA